MNKKVKYVKFEYIKSKDRCDFIPAPKKCIDCMFAEWKQLNLTMEEFEGCNIGFEIKEGKRICPHKGK